MNQQKVVRTMAMRSAGFNSKVNEELENALEEGYRVVMCNPIGNDLEYILEKGNKKEYVVNVKLNRNEVDVEAVARKLGEHITGSGVWVNKVILMGRLTRDPEMRYSKSSNPVAVARYGIAVRKQFTKQGEPDVDFFSIVAFGKAGEFASKYFKKGQMVAIVGRLQTNSWTDDKEVRHTTVDIVIEEQHFAESKNSKSATDYSEEAIPIQEYSDIVPPEEDDDLPF